MDEISCIFCGIVSERAPASIVYRDGLILAFMDIRPVTAGHALVVSRQHEPLVAGLDEVTWTQMCVVARHLAHALRQVPELRCDAVSLYVADGVEAGQEVPHAHLHAIPRYVGDGFGFRFPAGYGEIKKRGDLDSAAAAIRRVLSTETAPARPTTA